MRTRFHLCHLVALPLILAAAVPIQAQSAASSVTVEKTAEKTVAEYAPKEWQEGKDVIWLPSDLMLVDKMLDMAKVTPHDFVIDLGSGDGRTVIAAAKRGARALGIEFNPDLVELSRRNAAREGVADKATFTQADLFESDLSAGTVITMFLLPDINLKLRPRILELKPGTRIVSNSFDMDTWRADETVAVADDCDIYCKAYLWIVPARVAGTWELPQGELVLKQDFQQLSGTLQTRDTSLAVTGKLRGNQLSLQAGNFDFFGHVNGESIQGSFSSTWSASKKH